MNISRRSSERQPHFPDPDGIGTTVVANAPFSTTTRATPSVHERVFFVQPSLARGKSLRYCSLLHDRTEPGFEFPPKQTLPSAANAKN